MEDLAAKVRQAGAARNRPDQHQQRHPSPPRKEPPEMYTHMVDASSPETKHATLLAAA